MFSRRSECDGEIQEDDFEKKKKSKTKAFIFDKGKLAVLRLF